MKLLIAASSLLLSASCFADTWNFDSVAAPGGYTVYDAGALIEGWAVVGNCAGSGSNCVLGLSNTYTETNNSNGNTLQFLAQSGAGSLDLTGGGNTGDGGILRTQNTVAGTSYTLSFYVGNIDGGDSRYLQPAGIDLYINNTLVAATPTHTNPGTNGNLTNWLLQTYTFTATGPVTVIAFVNATNAADSYAGLDSVSFNPTIASIPEPSTYVLIGGSLLGLAAFRRRRV